MLSSSTNLVPSGAMGCAATVPLHDLTAESEPKPDTSGFRCQVKLEQTLCHLRRHSRTVVIDFDDRPTVARNQANDDAAARVHALRGGIDRIADDVVEDLLDPDQVGLHQGDRTKALDGDVDAARVRAFHAQRSDLEGWIDEIQW